MLTLRCTAKILSRLGTSIPDIVPASTTRLGDWYANLLFWKPEHLILCVSEKTLLPVVIPARDLPGMADRLTVGLMHVLRSLGIPEQCIVEETAAMTPVTFAKTANRSVVGTLNDFAYLLEGYLDGRLSVFDATLRVATAPCRCSKQVLFPIPATREAFDLAPETKAGGR